MQRLLGKLPPRDRKVVRLHYLEGRSYEEISTELNIPVNTIGPKSMVTPGSIGVPVDPLGYLP